MRSINLEVYYGTVGPYAIRKAKGSFLYSHIKS